MDNATLENGLGFSFTNEEERKEIYGDIGFSDVEYVKPDDPLKAQDIDVLAKDEEEQVTISEKFDARAYNRFEERGITVEIYTSFNERKFGWVNYNDADQIAYFFSDSVVMVDGKSLLEYVRGLLDNDGFIHELDSFGNMLIETGRDGKAMHSFSGITVLAVRENDRTGLTLRIKTRVLEENGIQVTEIYFEE